MISNTYAAVDLGSNACRLLICNEEGCTLLMENYSTRLAEGMYVTGCITEQAFGRGREAFVKIKNNLEKFGVEKQNLRAVATAACRMAKNGNDFINEMEKVSGIRLEIIDGREEAELNLQGAAVHVRGKSKYLLIWDVGGGSSEVTLAKNKDIPQIIKTISIPYGARNGAEEFDLHEYDATKAKKLQDKINEYMDAFLDIEMPKDICFVATSSTALRLEAIIEGRTNYVREDEDGHIITRSAMNSTINDLFDKSVAEMAKHPCIGETRAPIFLAAVVIFAQIAQRLNADNITASLKSAKDAIVANLIERDKKNGKAN